MPKVSVLVQTYNHAPYIQACLEGILNQVTLCDLEILVHDDASTDGTAEILRSLAATYPQINLMIQTENQYSLGRNAMRLNAARATGDYLAICDGDDQWIDPHKLQKQVDVLEAQSEVSLVVHAFQKVLATDPHRSVIVRYPHPEVDLEDMIRHPGCYFSYSTFVFRRKDLDYGEDFNVLRITDLPRLLYSGLIGTIVYLDEVLSLYRKGVPHSYNHRNLIDRQTTIAHTQRAIDFFTRFKAYAPQHTDVIDRRIEELRLRLCVKSRDNALRTSLRSAIKALPFKARIRFELEYAFPSLFRFYLSHRLSNTL